MYDVVIIGGGMAGMTAAIYLRRAGKSVLVLESGACGGKIVSALKVENWPGYTSISGADLMKKVYEQAANLGVTFEYEEVMEVSESAEYDNTSDADEGVRKLWAVKTDDDVYMAKAVIIATGTEPRKISEAQLKDAGGRPISYCATCDGALYKGKPVVVIGSGNTAKHEMKYLEGICSKVYHVHHDEPLPSEAEAIFVAIGRVPATGLFADLVDLDEEGYVVAGENCTTSCPGIFVAGDCRTKDVRQLVTAAGDGAVASAKAVNFLSRKKV